MVRSSWEFSRLSSHSTVGKVRTIRTLVIRVGIAPIQELFLETVPNVA